MLQKVKITVLKCLFDADLKQRYIDDPDYGSCPYFTEGSVFLSDGSKPENFACNVGWKSIRDEVSLLIDGNGPFDRQVVCCNDGVRPVIFLLEKTV